MQVNSIQPQAAYTSSQYKSITNSAFKKYKILADFSPSMIDVYEYATGKYIYVNHAVVHILGYKPENLLKGGVEFITSRIHPDDAKKTLKKNYAASKAVENLKSNTNDSKPFVSLEYRVMHKKGHWVWLRTDASVYSRTKDGKLEYIINTCLDITKQKSVELELQFLTKKLHESQELLRTEHKQLINLNNAKDDFISIASHQLRTPATGVKQYVGMMLDGYAGEFTEEQIELLKVVYESNERQLKLINDLLKIIQIDSGNVKLRRKKFDLVRMIKEIKLSFEEKLRLQQQELIIEYVKKPVEIRADESFVRMVADNLIDNASKYSDKGHKVKVSIYDEEKYAVFSIQDDGIGISKKDQKKLFQKFTRLGNSYSYNVNGTGIGLYWAKKIIDLHSGKIEVNSRSKKGTTFTVKLPRPL